MEKVMVLLRRSEADDRWCARLRGPVAAALLELNLPGVTVNVCDAPVRDTQLRLTTLAPPVLAAVTLWTHRCDGPQTRAAIDSLAGECDSAAAYLVTESAPLPPPATAAGERTPGLANLALLRRPAELDHADWLARWQLDHTEVAITTQASFGYTQNVVVRALTEDAPAVDGIVEELFPAGAGTDPHIWYGARDDADLADRLAVMMASVARFGADRDLDTVPTSRYVLRSPFGQL